MTITFDENGSKFSKWVENTVGKGEITHYEQFLLSPQCFQKTYTTDTQKLGLVAGKGLGLMCMNLMFPCLVKSCIFYISSLCKWIMISKH